MNERGKSAQTNLNCGNKRERFHEKINESPFHRGNTRRGSGTRSERQGCDECDKYELKKLIL